MSIQVILSAGTINCWITIFDFQFVVLLRNYAHLLEHSILYSDKSINHFKNEINLNSFDEPSVTVIVII